MEIAAEVSLRSPEAVGHIKFLSGKRARSPDRATRIAAEIERFALHVDGRNLALGLAAFRAEQKPAY